MKGILRSKRSIWFRLVGFIVALGLALPLAQDPALAQTSPANDDFDSATVIPGLPFSEAINTGEATTAADDPDCVGQGPTVWYAFTPAADTWLTAHTFGSDYDTTLSAYTGARGSLTQLACNDDAGGTLQSRITFEALAGETYYFMVGAFASGPGGNLVFTLDVAPPPPPPLLITLQIDPTGSVVAATGVVTLRGTVTCSRPAYVDLYGTLQQKAGRAAIRGFFGTFISCEGETSWSATVTGEYGRFVGGKAHASAFAFAYDPQTGDSAFDQVATTVQLRGSRRERAGDENIGETAERETGGANELYLPFVAR